MIHPARYSKIGLPLVYLFLFLSLPFSHFAQLNIIKEKNADNLAKSILGDGISIKNARLNCGASGSGLFINATPDLGLSGGILLTSGNAVDAANKGSFFCNTINGNNFNDPDLLTISSQARYDVCILEFDFMPICDTLRIGYVFGSEEYPKYLHQQYNDAFGIFLTGPNPNGGTYAEHNIATLPNGTTPVSIDSINAGWPVNQNASHPEFYHDNYTAPNNDIAYDGYTIPILSKALLSPCSTYHLKIAIADGGNGHNDSGVFIKGNSFTCNNIPVVTSNTIFSCANNGTISVNVSNYNGTPSYTWYPGGQHTDSLKNAAPGTYTCVINLPGICSDFTVTPILPGSSTLSLNTANEVLCSGKTAQLNASGALSYTWSPSNGLNNISTPNPIASPSVTTSYTVKGLLVNGCTGSAIVTLSVSPPLSADFAASAYETDLDSASIRFYSKGMGASQWSWDFQDLSDGSRLENPTHNFADPGIYFVTLTATNVYGCTDEISKRIVINEIIKDLVTFYAPDAFTPNSDLMNDVFLPKGIGWDPSNYTLEIYDKWGSQIFSTTDPLKGWDGTVRGKSVDIKQDVYVWKVRLKDVYKLDHFYSGVVTVVK